MMSMSTTNGKRLTEPKGFTGRREEAQLWLFKVQAYFRANKTLYVDDKSKIYFVLGLCEKTPVVQKWAESKYMALAHHQIHYEGLLAAHAAITTPTAIAVAITAATAAGAPAPVPPITPIIPLELTYDNFINEFKMR